MDHYKVIHFDGTSVIHLDGIFQHADVAFCGQDLIGDSKYGWHPAELTKEKVTCALCIKIVKAAKKVKSTEFKR